MINRSTTTDVTIIPSLRYTLNQNCLQIVIFKWKLRPFPIIVSKKTSSRRSGMFKILYYYSASASNWRDHKTRKKEGWWYPTRSESAKLGEKIEKVRLRWFGHVRRREPHHITRWVMERTEDGKRPRGRPKKRWMDCVKGDLSWYNIEEGLALDRSQWRAATRRPDLPWGVTRMMIIPV